MFPALEKELSKNEFFKVWKQHSLWEQLIGPPQTIREEFSQQWINEIASVIGDSPLSSRFLANLELYLKEIRKMPGYEHIKEKLNRLDEHFYPTLSEMQFIDLILYNTSPTLLCLEHTFQTPQGKHPELMVKHTSGPVYFEVTRIADYQEMNTIIAFSGIISAFQVGLRNMRKLNRSISVDFKAPPNNEVVEKALLDVNNKLNAGSYTFQLATGDYSVDMSEGDEVAVTIPAKIVENKLKDKLDEETMQFDKDSCNFVVVDATAILADLRGLSNMVERYFNYSGNDILWGVFLMSTRWIIGDNFDVSFKLEASGQPNQNGRNKDLAQKIIDDLFPVPTDK